MRKCQVTEENLILYFYGELPFEESQALEEHLSACPLCAKELRLMQGTLDLLTHKEIEEPPSAAWEKVFPRILRELGVKKEGLFQRIKVRIRIAERLAHLGGYIGRGLRANWRRSIRVPVPVAAAILLVLLGSISLSLLDRLHPSRQWATQSSERPTSMETQFAHLRPSETSQRLEGPGPSIPFVMVPMGLKEAFSTIIQEKDPIIFIPVPAINPNIPRPEEKEDESVAPTSL